MAALLIPLAAAVGGSIISKKIMGGGPKPEAVAPATQQQASPEMDKTVALPDANQDKVELENRRKATMRGRQSGRQSTILSQNNANVTGFGG